MYMYNVYVLKAVFYLSDICVSKISLSLSLSPFIYQASMQAVISTPECYRRANIWTNLGIPGCAPPLGDQNVWGTLFELQENKDVIIVATKVHIELMLHL